MAVLMADTAMTVTPPVPPGMFRGPDPEDFYPDSSGRCQGGDDGRQARQVEGGQAHAVMYS